MRTGLIIGKFLPPHKGHLGLVDFALKNCDRLIVAVCSRPEEPIPGSLRFEWMKELLGERGKTKVVRVRADLPQDKKPSRRASKAWAEYLLRRLGKIDIVFSSEGYGDFLAEYMKIKHLGYDLKRKEVSVSGTMIRENPFKYWEYVPEVVRPYFVKKICIYGSESTGKTMLTKQLADYYETVWVPEYAREYILKKENKFVYEDLVKIARGHLKSIKEGAKKANKLLFIDTDFITTQIYSHHYFGKCDDLVERLADKKIFDHYLFMEIDLSWKEDPQRDLGHRRDEFKKIFMDGLIKRGLGYTIVKGRGKKRLKSAVSAVEKFLAASRIGG